MPDRESQDTAAQDDGNGEPPAIVVYIVDPFRWRLDILKYEIIIILRLQFWSRQSGADAFVEHRPPQMLQQHGEFSSQHDLELSYTSEFTSIPNNTFTFTFQIPHIHRQSPQIYTSEITSILDITSILQVADTRLPSDSLRQSLFLQTISLESIYSLTGEMRREGKFNSLTSSPP